MSVDNLRVVYDAAQYYIPAFGSTNFEEFQDRMSSEKNRKRLYGVLVKSVPQLGSYEEFNKRIITPEKPEFTTSELFPPQKKYYFAPMNPEGTIKTDIAIEAYYGMSIEEKIQEQYDNFAALLTTRGTSTEIEAAKATDRYIEDPTTWEYFAHGFLNEFTMGMDQNILTPPQTLDGKIGHVIGSFSGMLTPFTKTVQISSQGVKLLAKKAPQAVKNVVNTINATKHGEKVVRTSGKVLTNVIGFTTHGQLYTHPPGTTIEQRLEEMKHDATIGALFGGNHGLAELGKLGKIATVPVAFSIGWNTVVPESSTEDRWINALLLTALQVNSLKGQARIKAETEFRNLVSSAYKPEVGARMVQTAMDILAKGKIVDRFRPPREIAESRLTGFGGAEKEPYKGGQGVIIGGKQPSAPTKIESPYSGGISIIIDPKTGKPVPYDPELTVLEQRERGVFIPDKISSGKEITLKVPKGKEPLPPSKPEPRVTTEEIKRRGELQKEQNELYKTYKSLEEGSKERRVVEERIVRIGEEIDAIDALTRSEGIAKPIITEVPEEVSELRTKDVSIEKGTKEVPKVIRRLRSVEVKSEEAPTELTDARRSKYARLHAKQAELVDSDIYTGDPDFRSLKMTLFGKKSMSEMTDTELSQYDVELSTLKYGIIDLPEMKRPSIFNKLSAKFLHQAQNRGKTKPFKKFMTMIDFGDRNKHIKAGMVMEGFRRLGLGKMSKAKAEELADALERGEAPEYRRIMDNMFQAATDAGLKVTGYQENYFPRMMKPEVAKIVHSDLLDLQRTAQKLSKGKTLDDAVLSNIIQKRMLKKGINPKTKQLLKHLIETGQATTYVEAYNKLKSFSYNDAFNPFGNLEKARTLELPVEFWERDARVVLNRYTMGWAKRVAEAEAFGADGKVAFDVIEAIQRIDPKESSIAHQMLQSWTGSINRDPTKTLSGKASKTIETMTQFEVLTKIGLGTATIPNITQTFISTIPTAGVYRTSKGLFRLLLPGERSKVRSSGAIMETAARTWAGFETTGAMGKFTQFVLGLHFTPVNKFNNYLAASTAEVYIKDLHSIANKKGLRQQWAKGKLEKYGLDKETLTDDDVAGFMYRFSTDQQLLKNVLRDPLSSHDPRLRSLWLFKKFGVKQAQLIKDEVLAEVQSGNSLPLLRLAAGGYIGGQFVGWARNKIKTVQSGEEHYRDDEGMWESVIENYAAVGAMGVVSDIVTSGLFGDYPFVSTLEFAVSPVMVQTVEKIGDTLYKFGTDLQNYEWTDAARRALPNAVKLLGPGGTQVSKRLQTPSQVEGRLRFRKGKARQKILEAFANGNSEEAEKIYTSWNEHNLDNYILPREINVSEVIKFIKRKEEKRANP